MRIKQWMAVVSLAAAISPMTAMAATEGAEKSPRIVGGGFAPISDAPWQVVLDLNGALCGGAIISSGYVLTAAHCVERASASNITVYAGIEDLNLADGNGIAVASVVTNPNYNSSTLTADVALIQLAGALPSNAKPIQLVDSDDQGNLDAEFALAEDQNLYVSGWGETSTDGNVSRYLKRTYLDGVSDNSCGWTNSNGVLIQAAADAYICGNDPLVSTGVCSGDSGGPLVWQAPSNASDADRGYRLVGLVSFSSIRGCALTDVEDGFTQLNTYRDWISDNMNGGYSNPNVSFDADIFDASRTYSPLGDGGGGGSVSLYALLLLSFSLGLSIYSRRRFPS
ncbi:S1 family peptidase [Enterovibrio norvegicus]|uniref:S1 family peptidase n=1 Tax=Enterovibrio norvegicus TaxID=188144 RepID=UPI000C85E470|nr:serine protease [Enterovibrio norvegicus]